MQWWVCSYRVEMFPVLIPTDLLLTSEPSGDAEGGASTQLAGGEVGKVRLQVIPGRLPGLPGVPGHLHHRCLLPEGRAGETHTLSFM